MTPLTFADTYNMVAVLSKSDASVGFYQIVDFLNAHTIQYALVLRALIDGKKVVVSENVIRRDLLLDDANVVECLPNKEIFAELARMGYEKPPPKLTFYKGAQEDASNQGGKIEAIDSDKDITLVDVEKDEKNMAGYRMEHFRGMTHAKDRPIFEREYKKVQTMFKPGKDVEEQKKKRVIDETLLQESFKKLRAAEVSGSESKQEIPSNDLKEMSKEDVQNIVCGITEAYQSFEHMLKGFDREDLVALWNLVKEKFSSAVPSVDKEKALWVELKRLFESDAYDVLWKLQRYMHYPITWKLYTNCGVHQVSSTTRRHGMFMLIEKDYPLSNAVMILMLSGKLEVEENNEMARDLVMKIFIEANKPKYRRINVASLSITAAGSRLMMLGKVDIAAENGIPKRKKKTLIEAVRTMLVDSKFPTTFWAKAVNTAFYVLNRALVIKSYNKTPYELIRGKPPLIDLMKPFGCPITILNTNDYLGKFDEKADEGFFIGYFVVSKAMRVFNKRMRIVEETLNIRFLKNVTNVKRNEPDWLFDIDSLKISMNYVPIVVGFQTNVNAASPSPINAAETPTSTDAFEEHPFKQFSPFKNAFSLSHVPIMTPINNTRIFGNAYDDEAVEEEVDMNNVVSSYTIPDVPLTKFIKDHPKDQVIGTIETLVQTRQMTKINAEHARIEAIRLFLAYASFKDFVVYQIDVKSAFLYGKIEEKVYVCQPSGFEDLDFPNKVYKVEKALYGLHQAPRACQDKYVADILKKFNFSTIKTASTPMEPNKALVKDAEAEDANVHLYRSMIGSLMYLTASRPDITFTICACARFQVTQKTSHLHAVKRIFRYLKGQPKLGLWYPRDSPFDLEAYSDSDYAGASLNRKSATGDC
nr:hypothetical protein [Tanacetum cinerariifolium]